jgi:uncharacterized coiled-coil protein SlyX
MTEEDLRKAYFEWCQPASQNFHPSATMENATPKPSLEARMEWLEADASAQRTAILKLERAVFIHSCSVAVQGAAITWLIWKVLT